MDQYEELAQKLSAAGIKKSNMFGSPVLKLGRKPICGLESDGINFKLDPKSPLYAETLALKGAHIFQPVMKGGRTLAMKNWVVVPFVYSDRYMDLAAASIRIVESELLA